MRKEGNGERVREQENIRKVINHTSMFTLELELK